MSARYFFADFARTTPGKWPVADDTKDKKGETVRDAGGKPVRAMTLVTEGDDLRATFFDLWLRDVRPDLEKVPADYVTASGSEQILRLVESVVEKQEQRARTRKVKR